jgi:sugar lactone lactonase YvrE
MANIKELIQSIESGDSSFDEKLTAINKMEETLVAMREQEKEAVDDNVELIVEAIKLMEKKVADQLEIAQSIVPEKGDKGDKGQDGLQGRDGLNGKDGRDGKNGLDGKDGEDGVSVTDAKIDFDGSLIITLSTGREINVGEVVAPDLAERLSVISTMSTNTAVANITSGTIDGTVIGGTTPAAGTFTPLTVKDATVASKATGITAWNYSGKSISVSAQESLSTGLFFSSDGTKMYVVGSNADTVFQYNLGTAWDITTATFTVGNSLLISGQDGASGDIFFKPDGTAFYLVGDTNNAIFQYTIATPWVINTATYASKSFSVASQETSPNGLWFKPDGTIMYVSGSASDNINQYSLGTAWDVTTATFVQSFSLSSQDGTSSSLAFNSTGTSFYITGTTNDNIYQYNLGTAYDISTASFVDFLYIGFQEATATGLFIDSTADNRVYMCGQSTDAVYNYNTNTTTVNFTSDRFNLLGNSYIKGNFNLNGNGQIDGNLFATATSQFSVATVSSTFTASAAVNLSTTTSNISLGTAQTTGLWTAGSTSQTGIMTLGQSTVSQTTNIQAGATASGSTKTINIGTAGVSGSTTTIAIGSAVSGATSTTTLNGLVIDSISAAVSAAGANQANATPLVSNINNVTVVASAADGVRLPTAVAGMRILVRNTDAADILKIYPATGGQINALGANAAYSLVMGTTIELFASTATQWYTF